MYLIRMVVFIMVLSVATLLFAVEIEPSKIEMSAVAGRISTILIKVTNWLDYPVKINVKADYYRYILTENSIPPQGGKNKLPSCQNWLKFEPNEFQLNPRASMYVKCIIDVPTEASEERVASILFDEEGLVTSYESSPTKSGNITLRVVPRFTIPIYIAIEGNKKTSCEISDMKITEGPTLGTIKTEITLHNTGTIHLRPSGNLVFMDSEENIVKTLPIGQLLPLFPDYKEKVPVYCPQILEAGNYAAICTINISEGKLLQKKITFRITEDYEIQ